MTEEQLKEFHENFHKELDRMLARWLYLNTDKHLSKTSIMEFLEWSNQQRLNPTPIDPND